MKSFIGQYKLSLVMTLVMDAFFLKNILGVSLNYFFQKIQIVDSIAKLGRLK